MDIKKGILDGLKDIENTSSFIIKDISIDNIQPNPKNFYRVQNTDIDKLMKDIERNGLYHNLLVREIGEGKYELISGERRYTALKQLGYTKVPCKIDLKVNDIDAEIKLIQSNAVTRERTEKEKAEEVARLTKLYKAKRISGDKLHGNTKDLIANDLQLSSAQISRYMKVNSKLIPELKQLFDTEQLNISNANEFASLSSESQIIIYKMLQKNININRDQAKELRKQLEEKENELKKEKELQKIHEDKIIQLQESLVEKNFELQDIKDEINSTMSDMNDNKKTILEEELTEECAELIEKRNNLEIELSKIKGDIQNLKNMSIPKEETTLDIQEIENIKINTELQLIIKNLAQVCEQLTSTLNKIHMNSYDINNENKENIKKCIKQINNCI